MMRSVGLPWRRGGMPVLNFGNGRVLCALPEVIAKITKVGGTSPPPGA